MNEQLKAGADIHAGDGGYSIGTKEKYDEFVKNRNRMNERIRQLIEQATDTIEIVNPDTGITHYREFFDKEKFAELIVKECAELNKQELAFNAFERLLNVYKEHFGVEE
jgi:methionine synthase II (cobalamin-independent)